MHLPALVLLPLVAAPGFDSAASLESDSPPLQKISLRKLTQFTVRENAYTTGTNPIPQLECVGGSGQDLHDVEEMTCTNIAGSGDFGTDEINWRCVADVPPEFELGSTDVSCESWNPVSHAPEISGAPVSDTPEAVVSGDADEFVVDGSCRVSYFLMLTDLGEEKYGHLLLRRARVESKTTTTVEYFFWTGFVLIAGYILYSILFLSNSDVAANNRRLGPDTRHARANNNDDDDDDDGADDDDALPPHFYDAARSPSDGRGRENASWMPLAATGVAATGAAVLNAASGAGSRTRQRGEASGTARTRATGTGIRSTGTTTGTTGTVGVFDGGASGSASGSGSMRSSSGIGGTTRR